MSLKQNDTHIEYIKERLDEIGGVILAGEMPEEALQKELFCQKLHGGSRKATAKLLGEVNNKNYIVYGN